MSAFLLDTDLEIGTVFEVAGSAIKIALKRDITELTRSYSGRVYDVGQIGSIVKMHLGCVFQKFWTAVSQNRGQAFR
jgi:hypothetical protein